MTFARCVLVIIIVATFTLLSASAFVGATPALTRNRANTVMGAYEVHSRDQAICPICGQQYDEVQPTPASCFICDDDRQWVPADGQPWTSLKEMQKSGKYKNVLKEHEPGIIGIGTDEKFGIGQRCILVQTEEGNILWDCISYIDDETIDRVRDLGGIKAIIISHPHFQGACAAWADAFGAEVYMHESDKPWLARASGHPRFKVWSGEELEVLGGVKAIRLGGHFHGSSVLHLPKARSDGEGVLLSSDTIHVVPHQRWLSFMYSFPNLLPLPAPEVKRIRQRVSQDVPPFQRLYGAFWTTKIDPTAKDCVLESADRYLKALNGEYHA